MARFQVPRASWQTVIDEFSREHEGSLVTIEVMTPHLGKHVEAHGLPLTGLTADLGQHPAEIVVSVGRDPGAHVTHHVADPVSVSTEENQEGVVEVLRVVGRDEEELIVRLKVPAPLRDEDLFFR